MTAEQQRFFQVLSYFAHQFSLQAKRALSCSYLGVRKAADAAALKFVVLYLKYEEVASVKSFGVGCPYTTVELLLQAVAQIWAFLMR